MVKGMNHQYIYGGYLWPARLSTVYINVGVFRGADLCLWHQMTSLDKRQIGYNPFSQKYFNLTDLYSVFPLAKDELIGPGHGPLCPDLWPLESDQRIQQMQSWERWPWGRHTSLSVLFGTKMGNMGSFLVAYCPISLHGDWRKSYFLNRTVLIKPKGPQKNTRFYPPFLSPQGQ